MNKIDTEYTSLDQIDPAVVRFYEEEARERVVGYTEPDQEGLTIPVTEPYTVVVLNKPDEVSFEYVESRRGRRLGEDVAKAALVQAIAWNDFAVNHDGHLAWLAAYDEWEAEQPTEIVNEVEVLLPAPECPVVDIADQRAVYEKVTQPYDTTYFNQIGSTVVYNDKSFVAMIEPTITVKPDSEVFDYHSELAINTRYDAVYAPLAVGESFIDIGRGKDGVLGIDNVKDTLAGYDAGMTGIDAVMWIMTDNSVMELTINDLRQVIVDFNTRKQVAFMDYGQWRETDRLTPFVINQ
ncbi:putative DUF4376 domain-containing protein [Vibrio phage 168E36-1]|nr:putative DUF4376 domain-containing protein [Vibrio phage 168E36-1]